MLIVDSLRGTDSTGVAVIPRVGDVKVAKQVGNPFNLFDHKSYDRALMGTHRALIGHNRYTTSGGTSNATAHPFEFETLVGVHNGTLTNKWNLDDASDYKVDSENLYHHINKNGLKHAMSKVKGAWSLVWWDKQEEEINFLRNTERPLWMCRSVDGKHLFWASEPWMLHGVLSRNDVKYGELFSTDVDNLYTIGIGKDAKMDKAYVRPSPSTFKEPVHTGYFSGSTPNVHRPPLVVVQNRSVTPAEIKEDPLKKAGVAPITAPLGSDSYKPLGHVRLEIINSNRDQFGSTYFQCMDPNEQGVNIRLYYTRLPVELGSPDDVIGGSVLCQVNPVPTVTNKSRYYKVITSSVNWDDLEFDEGHKEAEEAYDHHNNLIGVEAWQKAYGRCCWCDSEVKHDHRHSLTTDGQSLCSDCSVDHTEHGALQYVTVAGGVRNRETV
jgi:hypothetical protein